MSLSFLITFAFITLGIRWPINQALALAKLTLCGRGCNLHLPVRTNFKEKT